ncbi:outer membrane beta-barrel protein [Erythrobacter aquimaris]|uniref:Outer membrane beta-barrel protein n=1 Tax=Qipengyuania aquimaris TaxID=255984 RepID=A0A6I4TMX0_9SPHN|nr:outer membrane beta-barrel protein [Qipengyuania aquimaris]MXO95888.1 outer membrane beta-barrel protein [Qipengyuania aquimaris]
MKKVATLLVAGSAIAMAAPAAAQDNSPFTGPRVEVVGGYDVSKAGSSIDDDVNEDNDQSIEGVVYGVGLGYDFNAGGVVLGLEGELTDSTADVEFDDGDFEGFGLGDVNAGRDIYVGARVGVLAQPDLLVYAKGGYTNGRYNINSSFDGEEYAAKLDTDGYRLGAGVEYALDANTFAKVEYRYSNYSDAELDFEGDIADVDVGEIDTDRHQVMVGFGYRF